jgi:hypothetical protein
MPEGRKARFGRRLTVKLDIENPATTRFFMQRVLGDGMAGRVLGLAAVVGLGLWLGGCGETTKADRGFFTSGSREADQRAEQRMAKAEQLRGDLGTGGGEKGDEQTPARRSLYERLGGEAGVKAIVEDFVTRSLADPRVNWERKAVGGGGVRSPRRGRRRRRMCSG